MFRKEEKEERENQGLLPSAIWNLWNVTLDQSDS